MLAPAFDVLRELGHALVSLLLAPFRHAWGLATRNKRLKSFATLQREPLPQDRKLVVGAPIQDLVFAVGDASGEIHALEILAALREQNAGLELRGFGGRQLQAAGMRLWMPLADLNIMGFRDVAAQLPLFVRAVSQFSRELRERRPDAVLLVDYPGLNRHLLRIAHRLKVPVVQYVAPQLWAWAPWRVRDFRRANRLLAILPFEPDWYRRHQAKASFIGHPLGDELPQVMCPLAKPGEGLRIALLPGSRKREVRQNLPVMLAAAAEILKEKPDTRFVLPHLREDLWPLIETFLALQPDVPVERAPGRFHQELLQCHGCLVVSGTASLEAIMLGLATVVVYQLPSRLAAWLAKHALSVPWIASANLIAGEELVKEHLGRNLSPEAIARDLLHALEPTQIQAYRDRLGALRAQTMAPGSSKRAADALTEVILEHRTANQPVR